MLLQWVGLRVCVFLQRCSAQWILSPPMTALSSAPAKENRAGSSSRWYAIAGLTCRPDLPSHALYPAIVECLGFSAQLWLPEHSALTFFKHLLMSDYTFGDSLWKLSSTSLLHVSSLKFNFLNYRNYLFGVTYIVLISSISYSDYGLCFCVVCMYFP